MPAGCPCAQHWTRASACGAMALQRGLEALDRRQGWRGALASHTGDGDLDGVLAKHQASMLEDHHAAYVTEVTKDQAQIYVNGGRGRIPFQLAFWAYPPRGEDGVRPQPLNDFATRSPSVTSSWCSRRRAPRPDPRRVRTAAGDYALSQRPSVEGRSWRSTAHRQAAGDERRLQFLDSEFNRAVQALRQPGSAFKPFVYLPRSIRAITRRRAFSTRLWW